VRNGLLTVLASSAESPETVDAAVAAAQVQEADAEFSSLSFYDPNYPAVQEALALARARVEAAALKTTAR